MSTNRERKINRKPSVIRRAAVNFADFAGWLTIVNPSLLESYFRAQRAIREREIITRTIAALLHEHGDPERLNKLEQRIADALQKPLLRLLLAEDEETNRWLRKVVEEVGLEVVGEVSDRREILQEAFSLKPDIVLMDVQMPSLSGLEVIREITKNLSSTKVVIMSSMYSPDIEREAIEAGAMRYLQKEEFDIFEMLKTVYPDRIFVEASPNIRLSPLQRRIINLLNELSSNREIAADLAINEKTIRRLVKTVEESSGR